MAINATGAQIAVTITEVLISTESIGRQNVSNNSVFNDYEIHKELKVLHLIVCILGLAANGLSTAATCNIPHGLTTHSKLIISLCVSDSLILVAVISHFFTYIDSSSVACFFITKRVLQDTAVLATLLNLLAMAADHYLAIMKPLSYKRFMTSFRCNCLITALWILSFLTGLLEVIVGRITEMDIPVPFCMKISLDEFDSELIMTIIIFVVLLAVVVFYTRIYFVVKDIIRHDQMLYHDQQHNYKATVTTMLIIGTFIIFWTPLAIFKILTSLHAQELYASKEEEMRYVDDSLLLLLLLNSLADPLIYAIRLQEVQKGYKVMLFKLFPNHRFSMNEEEFRNQHSLSCSKRRDTMQTLVHDNTSVPSPDSDKCYEFSKKTEETSFIPDTCSEQSRSCRHIC